MPIGYDLPHRRAMRACVTCGHSRAVMVRIWRRTAEDGTVLEAREEHTRTCTACDYDMRAAMHERAALEFRRRATAIRAKRKG